LEAQPRDHNSDPADGVKTFHAEVAKLDYKGMSRTGWGADYMIRYVSGSLFHAHGKQRNWLVGSSIRRASRRSYRTIDHQRRYEILAQAEQMVLDAQPIIPLVVGTTRWMKKPYVKGMYPTL